MRRRPTERRAARAAREFHHRDRLRWICDAVSDNEVLLLTYLSQLERPATVPLEATGSPAGTVRLHEALRSND